jgi:hypothetical protein
MRPVRKRVPGGIVDAAGRTERVLTTSAANLLHTVAEVDVSLDAACSMFSTGRAPCDDRNNRCSAGQSAGRANQPRKAVSGDPSGRLCRPEVIPSPPTSAKSDRPIRPCMGPFLSSGFRAGHIVLIGFFVRPGVPFLRPDPQYCKADARRSCQHTLTASSTTARLVRSG